MRKLALLIAAILGPLLFAAPAHAGSAHFVGNPTVTRAGDTLTVSFKIAGLGNEDQTVTVTADAQCWNPGGNAPRAENKGAVLASGVFSPKNGNITDSLSGSATTDPSCVPPMELVYANVTVTVQPAGISVVLPGTY
jgi:hypothetical protein